MDRIFVLSTAEARNAAMAKAEDWYKQKKSNKVYGY